MAPHCLVDIMRLHSITQAPNVKAYFVAYIICIILLCTPVSKFSKHRRQLGGLTGLKNIGSTQILFFTRNIIYYKLNVITEQYFIRIIFYYLLVGPLTMYLTKYFKMS